MACTMPARCGRPCGGRGGTKWPGTRKRACGGATCARQRLPNFGTLGPGVGKTVSPGQPWGVPCGCPARRAPRAAGSPVCGGPGPVGNRAPDPSRGRRPRSLLARFLPRGPFLGGATWNGPVRGGSLGRRTGLTATPMETPSARRMAMSPGSAASPRTSAACERASEALTGWRRPLPGASVRLGASGLPRARNAREASRWGSLLQC